MKTYVLSSKRSKVVVDRSASSEDGFKKGAMDACAPSQILNLIAFSI